MKKYYTQAEAARYLGVSETVLHTWRIKGIANCGVKIRGRWQLSEGDLEALAAIIKSREQFILRAGGRFYTISRAADAIGVPRSTLWQKVRRGIVIPPSHISTIRPMYHESELPKVKEGMDRRILSNIAQIEALQQGWYNKTQAATFLGMPLITLVSYINRGKVAEPTHKVCGHLRYTRQELEEIRATCLADYFAERNAKATAL